MMLDDLAADDAEAIATESGPVVVLPPRRVVPIEYWTANHGEFFRKYLRHFHRRSQNYVDRRDRGG